MKSKQKIFLVEDDNNFGAVLKSYLEIHDYHVKWVLDGKDAFAEFKKDDFESIIKNLCEKQFISVRTLRICKF